MNKYDLIKTTEVYQKLLKDYNNKTFSHCNLLVSNDKLSREIFAVNFASLLICEDKDEVVIHNIVKKIHPDVFFLPKSDSLKVEDVESIFDKLNYFPVEANCKVFILENFSSATIQAQNKLLKTLEETPNNVYFLLCSEREDGILPTIKSRCQILELQPLKEDIIKGFFRNVADEKLLELSNFYGRGELGKIEEAFYNPAISKMVDLSLDIIENCSASKDILKFTVQVLEYKNNLVKFLNIFADVLEEILKTKILGKSNYNALKFKNLVDKLSVEAILILQEKIIKFIEMLSRFCNSTLIVDELLIQVCKCKML